MWRSLQVVGAWDWTVADMEDCLAAVISPLADEVAPGVRTEPDPPTALRSGPCPWLCQSVPKVKRALVYQFQDRSATTQRRLNRVQFVAEGKTEAGGRECGCLPRTSFCLLI